MGSSFYEKRAILERQFQEPNWLSDSGISSEILQKTITEWEETISSKSLVKAKTFALIAEKAPIGIDPCDRFQDKLMGGSLMKQQRKRWERAAAERYYPEEASENKRAWNEWGAYRGLADFGHISPNTRLLLSVGLSGLLTNVEQAAAKGDLTESQSNYYDACRTVLCGMMTVARRLAEAILPYNKENSDALAAIAERAPENGYEAMQLLVLYFFLHEYVAGARVRTLGRLDVLLFPFYQKDLANGTYTKEDYAELLRFFLHKFWSAKVPYDLPFCLGGLDENGNDITNELSYLIVETYNELNIHSPKIHIRVCDKTPERFVKLVLSCIRDGNSSFVFVNDRIAAEALCRVGIKKEDAWDYVPIGCYEPAVWGKELGCTGNGGVNLAKAVEWVFTDGIDCASGERCGVQTGRIQTFEEFLCATKAQITHMTQRTINHIITIEQHYKDIYPDPILSCQYEESVKQGLDVYEGGASYNNSSLCFYGIATLIDSLCAVKKLVFDEHLCSVEELGTILQSNWTNNEALRKKALRLAEKYGNGNPAADALTTELSAFCASLANHVPNGRGGVFKASLYSIDHCFFLGERTMATPDGRLAGDPLSKNLCATVGMDKKGITALVSSVTKIDHASFPNGSVLDIVLHPSAVSGEDGLSAFYAILLTYLKKGGFALHGNVFDAEILKQARTDPERYQTLQVRVCGWNAYFVNLSPTEQDAFIRQAET